MKWPSFWSSGEEQNHDKKSIPAQARDRVADASQETLQELKQIASEHQHESSRFTTTQTLGLSLLSCALTLGALRVYKHHLRRIPAVDYLRPEALRKKSLYGYVTSVGDGDNFHFFHTPGGRLLGWGTLRSIPKERKALQNQTLHVRIAGVDAPELAHFGRPAQPYGQEALEWLRSQVLHRYVRVLPWRKDQYERVVCSVHYRRFGIFRKDVGQEMIKAGFATVYEAKFGSEFGDKEEDYRAAEEQARRKKVGMWSEPGLVNRLFGKRKKDVTESPREFKNRMKQRDRDEMAK